MFKVELVGKPGGFDNFNGMNGCTINPTDSKIYCAVGFSTGELSTYLVRVGPNGAIGQCGQAGAPFPRLEPHPLKPLLRSCPVPACPFVLVWDVGARRRGVCASLLTGWNCMYTWHVAVAAGFVAKMMMGTNAATANVRLRLSVACLLASGASACRAAQCCCGWRLWRLCLSVRSSLSLSVCVCVCVCVVPKTPRSSACSDLAASRFWQPWVALCHTVCIRRQTTTTTMTPRILPPPSKTRKPTSV